MTNEKGGIMTWILLIFFGLIILSAIGFFSKIVLFPWFVANKGVNTAYEITDKTLDADNVIYNYEWFKSQKEAISASYQKLVIAQDAVKKFEDSAGARKEWTFEDKNEHARLNAVAQGIESITKDMIAEYNAKSQMANRNIFKDGLIPDTMEFGANLINK